MSSALRFGTTRHLEPSADQYMGMLSPADYSKVKDEHKMDLKSVKPAKSIQKKLDKMKAEKWIDENNLTDSDDPTTVYSRNLENLILASERLVDKRLPEFKDISFNSNGAFEYNGKSYNNSSDLFSDLDLQEQAQFSGVGDSTLARAGIAKALIEQRILDDMASVRFAQSRVTSDLSIQQKVEEAGLAWDRLGADIANSSNKDFKRILYQKDSIIKGQEFKTFNASDLTGKEAAIDDNITKNQRQLKKRRDNVALLRDCLKG